MSYLQQHGAGRGKAGAAVAVAILEGIAVIALVRGLAVTWAAHEEPPPLASQQWKLDPPPPPPPDPRDTARDETRPIQPIQPRNLPHAADTGLADPLPLSGGPVIDPGAYADPVLRDPLPSPSPAFVPRAARPQASPASWVSANDYPARDLREGNQGTARFSLVVGTDGKVQSCVVTRSSGHAGLDAATCKAVMRRARFEAASDENGARVTGGYSGSIRWTIPD